MFVAPPTWFRDEVHTLICRGDISPEEGLLTMVFAPEWAYGDKPVTAGTVPPPAVLMKTCSCCGIEFPEADFYVKPDGQVHNVSRPCESAKQRQRRAAWTEEQRARERARDAARRRKVQVAA